MSPFERGSRRHVLDLLSATDAPDQLDTCIAPSGYRVARPLQARPRNASDTQEYTLRAFWREQCSGWGAADALDDWWVADQYKNPTWDLIVVCEGDGRRGLLLVEAKAHEAELDWKGKRALDAEADSAQAHENDRRIRAAIAEAGNWFSEVASPAALTSDSHYQFTNRLASAYKVASVGVPVVLLYLGFTGDTYFRDHLRDAAHWHRLMSDYISGVVPRDLPGRTLPHASGGSMSLLIGALPVRSLSRRAVPVP